MMKFQSQTPGPNKNHQRWSFRKPLFFWVRMVLGGVFVFASLNKILHPLAFAKVIDNYQILPDKIINLAAIILPWIEVILGCFLILGIWLPGAIVLINLLLIVFLTGLVFNIARGLNIECGCFSTNTAENPSSLWYLARDAVFLLMGGYLFYKALIKPVPTSDKRT
jgi:uncharacterized membrane protein YphA (DoxX/SURF4 family)